MAQILCILCGKSVTPEALADESKDGSPVCQDCADRVQGGVGLGPSQQQTILRPSMAPRKATGPEFPQGPVPAAGTETTYLPPTGPAEPAPKALSNRQALIEPAKGSVIAKQTAVGKKFGNYEILQEISRGSFGVVYRAKQTGLDRAVALKVLLAGSHASPEAVARFQREARAVAKLKHPNIVPIYEIGTQDGHHFFAMEFIRGDSLSDLIERKALGTSQTLVLTEKLADAIQSAHQEGVIHRDLKPSNILVDQQGEPHITDFGLAKQVDLDTKYTQSGTTLGTPAYMPPEQARGEVEKVDARSDVYALGAVLYEMLTGRPPFSGRSLLEVVIAVINEPVRPPRQLNPVIHRDIQTLVMKCLEKEAANRYASAADLRDDIRRFRSGEAIHARPVSPLRKAARFLRRHGLFLSTAAAVLFALAYLMLKLHQSNERERQRIAEEQRKRRNEQLASVEKWETVWTYDPAHPSPPPPEPGGPGVATHATGLRSSPLLAQAQDLVGQKIVTVPPLQQLISPLEESFQGDIEAEIRLTLDAQAAAQGFRVGLQSCEQNREIVPLIFGLQSGALTFVGPSNLKLWEVRLSPRRSPLTPVLLAEKKIPPLQAGSYTIRISRQELTLDFQILGPAAETSSRMSVWNLSLAHWLLKRVVLVFRDKPAGMTIQFAQVKRKFPPERIDPLKFAKDRFLRGEDDDALNLFRRIADEPQKTPTTPAELALAAEAKFYLGLIHETYQPLDVPGGESAQPVAPGPQPQLPGAAPPRSGDAPLSYYQEALACLERIPHPNELQQRLEGMIRLRRLIRSFYLDLRNHDPQACLEQLSSLYRMASFQQLLSSPQNRGLGEPFAWELVPLVRRCASLPALAPDRLDPPHRADKAALNEFKLLLQLFQLLDLAPGFRILDEAARVTAEILAKVWTKEAAAQRGEELKEFHRRYPLEGNHKAFAKLIQQQLEYGLLKEAWELLSTAHQLFPGEEGRQALASAGKELLAKSVVRGELETAQKCLNLFRRPDLAEQLGTTLGDHALPIAQHLKEHPRELAELCKLLQAAAAIRPREGRHFTALSFGAQRLCLALIESGQAVKIKQIHSSWDDSTLAGAFVKALDALRGEAFPATPGQARPGALTEACDLLAYFRKTKVAVAHHLFDRAAKDLASAAAVVDEAQTYQQLIPIQRAWGSDHGVGLAGKVLQTLLDQQLFEQATTFYGRFRGSCRGEGARALAPTLVRALKKQPPEAALQQLNDIREELALAFQEAPGEALAWTAEQAEICLYLGLLEETQKALKEIQSSKVAEPALIAQATFRSGLLQFLQGSKGLLEAWSTASEQGGPPREFKLAADLVAGRLSAAQVQQEWQALPREQRVLGQADLILLEALRQVEEQRNPAEKLKQLKSGGAVPSLWASGMSLLIAEAFEQPAGPAPLQRDLAPHPAPSLPKE